MSAASIPMGGVSQRPQTRPYRPFFIVALVVILTTGAGWGFWFLWQISQTGRVTAAGLHSINAHAQTVIYGFIGLFIIGFGYQAFPRLWNQSLAWISLCKPVLGLMLVGISMLSIGEMQSGATVAGYLVIAGGVMQTLAVGLFFCQLMATFRRGSTLFNASTAMILTAAGFFVIHTPLNAWHTWNLVTTESVYEAVYYTSVYQPALRYLQFHGMTLLMVFGVASRLLPSFFNIAKPGERKLWAILLIVVLSVIGEAGVFISFRLLEEPRLAALLLIPWTGLLVASVMMVVPWKIWRNWKDVQGRIEQNGKFARIAFLWLIISLLMTIAQPAWSRFVDTYFSHAWYGASRQAFTVGFATMMIIAFTLKVVPTLNGVFPINLPRMNGVFVLINAGLLLHLVAQIGSEISSAWAKVLPLAGIMQWIGLALWAGHLFHCMIKGLKVDKPVAKPGVSLQVLGGH